MVVAQIALAYLSNGAELSLTSRTGPAVTGFSTMVHFRENTAAFTFEIISVPLLLEFGDNFTLWIESSLIERL